VSSVAWPQLRPGRKKIWIRASPARSCSPRTAPSATRAPRPCASPAARSACPASCASITRPAANRSGFLREHYTSSRESAAIIATYLESFGTPPAPGKRTGATKRTGKGDEKAKGDEKKAEPKSGETKSVKPDKTDKPPEAKTSGPKTSEPKSEPKPPDAKASEPKPAAAPAAKPDKPEKSD